jgi:SAM-dependent methyltransferase
MKSFSKKDINRNASLYDEYINGWKMPNGWHPGNQVYNFRALIRLSELTGIPLKGKDILDVGCGTGDFSAFLRKKQINYYVGIDIYKPSLDEARKLYPTETFIEGDLLTGIISEKFDYAFCSGAFTVKLSHDNYEFLEAMITKIWELTKIGLAFNVLTDDDTDQDQDLFFYNPMRVLQICHDIAPDAVYGAEKTPYLSQIHVYMYRNDAELRAKS